jgi:hypothetical protein
MYAKMFVHDIPPDVLKLFEDPMILINFLDNCMRVDFYSFHEMPLFLQKIQSPSVPRKEDACIFKKQLFKATIVEFLYGWIELALKEVLLFMVQ